MRIALVGASGYLGWFLVQEFLAAGHAVRALVRNAGTAAHLPAAVEMVTGDLGPDRDYGPFLEGADALVHAAYQHVPGRYRHGEGDDLAGYLEANVAGSLALMRQALNTGVGRCVFLSSRAVFGAHPLGTLLSEEMAAAPDTHYGAVKLAVEAFVSSFARQDGWCAASLRPTGIYGIAEPFGRTKWLDTVRAMLAGEAVPAGGGGAVHGADVARAVSLLLSAPPERVAGRAFNCGDLYVDSRDLARIVSEVTTRDVPLPPASDRAAYSRMDCAGLSELGFRFGGEAALKQCVAEIVSRIEAEGPG